jgi:hypothetical protein
MKMTALHEVAFRGHIGLYQELSRHPEVDPSSKDILENIAINYLDIDEKSKEFV